MYLQFENLLLLKIVLFKSGVDEYKNLSFKVKKISSLIRLVLNTNNLTLSLLFKSIFSNEISTIFFF